MKSSRRKISLPPPRALVSYALMGGLLLLAAELGSLYADNIIELRRLERLRCQAHSEVLALSRENARLKAQACALKRDPFYVELVVREKLRWMSSRELTLREYCRLHGEARRQRYAVGTDGRRRNADELRVAFTADENQPFNHP
jgi:cell division protein FtsB